MNDFKSLKKQDRKKVKINNRKIIKETINFVLNVMWKEKPGTLVIYIVLFIVQCLKKIQVILLPKYLFDELMRIINKEPLEEHLQHIIVCASIICGISLVAGIMESLATQRRAVFAEWFDEYVDVLLAEQTMKMEYEFTESPEMLGQISRAKEGIKQYSGGIIGILDSLFGVIESLLVCVGLSVTIFLICPLLFPIQFVSLIIMTVFNIKRNHVEVEGYERLAKVNRVFGYYMFQLTDFSYGKEVRLYNSSELMIGRAKEISEDIVKVYKENAQKKRNLSWGMDVINALRDGISYFYIGYLAIKNIISIGTFSMCVASASELYHSIGGVVFGWQNLSKRCGYVVQFLDFLEIPVAKGKGMKRILQEKHVIEFEHVYFKYPRTEQYVLEDINLKIVSGEHLAVVGLNGAGKTTFIKLLCRLYNVTSGKIMIDGIEIGEYSEEEYRKLFSVVFQDFQLFAFSLKENITLGIETDKDRIYQVLEVAGFLEDLQGLPNGLDTILYKGFDNQGIELSGGQRQKVAISRALFWDAPIVILDEPTAALDPMAEAYLYQRFDCLIKGKTAIYISHRLSSCMFCDRIVVFADRTIKEYGTHEELVSLKDGMYSKMFDMQARYYIKSDAKCETSCLNN